LFSRDLSHFLDRDPKGPLHILWLHLDTYTWLISGVITVGEKVCEQTPSKTLRAKINGVLNRNKITKM
jgi:hypothetical protein